MFISQQKYTLDILEDIGMMGCRPISFRVEQNLKLYKRSNKAQVDENQYRRLIVILFYLEALIPYVIYVVNILSHFVGDPRVSHFDVACGMLRYLKATLGEAICLTKYGGTNLIAYGMDANHQEVENKLFITPGRIPRIIKIKEIVCSLTMIGRSRISRHGLHIRRNIVDKMVTKGVRVIM